MFLGKHSGKMPLEHVKFTSGDFRRFSAMVYLFTRKILQVCDLVMARENKKRIMPRHLMTAMVQIGIIPLSVVKM